uniref:Polo kinase n=1 Tax=Pelusios castaneus TaxID=367368 RepID=A0A8C8SGG5_9SAUR
KDSSPGPSPLVCGQAGNLTAPPCTQGAFGRCYKSTDTATGQVYAIKIVSLSRISRLAGRGKVEREIELHSQLSHRHVVGFHRHFADRDNVYMVLEYCSRKSLAHVLKARKTLTEPEVRYYLRQIVAGLRYLHQEGILHRDLKLSNFFLTKNMQVKIGDLGLATREEQAGRRQGVVCGTPNYLAPEVIAKKGHSIQSDIWALGCSTYTALTGCSPFEVIHKQEMYQCIREGRYPIPSHLSPSARKLIGHLLAPNPSERPSLEEVLVHEFFTQGFTPEKLPSRACHSVPIFALPNPLSKLLQKAAKVLFRGSPCQEPQPGGSSGHIPPGLGWGWQWPCHGPGVSPSSPRGLREPLSWISSLPPSLPAAEQNPVQHLAPPILWVTRWVDYSNKYGFGYLLSDGSTGALLTDGTHLALCPRPPYVFLGHPSSTDTPCLLRCAKSDRALLMLFSNGTLQVNFYHNHTKIILSHPGAEPPLLTFIDQQRLHASFPLGILATEGCAPALRERLHYALDMIHCL